MPNSGTGPQNFDEWQAQADSNEPPSQQEPTSSNAQPSDRANKIREDIRANKSKKSKAQIQREAEQAKESITTLIDSCRIDRTEGIRVALALILEAHDAAEHEILPPDVMFEKRSDAWFMGNCAETIYPATTPYYRLQIATVRGQFEHWCSRKDLPSHAFVNDEIVEQVADLSYFNKWR